MRRLILAAMCGILLCTNVGCFIPIYEADPAQRVRQLIWNSEDMRAMRAEWQRFWFQDQPSHLSPVRVHGGVI